MNVSEEYEPGNLVDANFFDLIHRFRSADDVTFIGAFVEGLLLSMFFFSIVYWCPYYEWPLCNHPKGQLYQISIPPVLGSFWGVELLYSLLNTIILFDLLSFLPTYYEEAQEAGFDLDTECNAELVDSETEERNESESIPRCCFIGNSSFIVTICLSLVLTASVHLYKFYFRKRVDFAGRKRFWAATMALIGAEDIPKMFFYGTSFYILDGAENDSIAVFMFFTSVFVLCFRLVFGMHLFCCSKPVFMENNPSQTLLIQREIDTEESDEE